VDATAPWLGLHLLPSSFSHEIASLSLFFRKNHFHQSRVDYATAYRSNQQRHAMDGGNSQAKLLASRVWCQHSTILLLAMTMLQLNLTLFRGSVNDSAPFDGDRHVDGIVAPRDNLWLHHLYHHDQIALLHLSLLQKHSVHQHTNTTHRRPRRVLSAHPSST
jgi:hypothetical protein